MDQSGYETVKATLQEAGIDNLLNQPTGSENKRFVDIFLKPRQPPSPILNTLDEAGLIYSKQSNHQAEGPLLRLLGVSTHYLVFEDMNSPR